MAGVWTNNWKGLINSAILGGFYREGTTTAYDYQGKAAYMTNGNISSPVPSRITNDGSPGSGSLSIRFGQSDTTPDVSQYSLGDDATNNLTYINSSVISYNWDANTHTLTRSYRVTIQNKNAATITIREYGVYVGAYLTSNNGGTRVMLYREVLDEPVTLGQYESGTINISLSITIGDPV